MTSRSTRRNVFFAIGLVLVILGIGLAWMGSSEPLPDESRFWLGEPGALETLRSAAAGVGPEEVRVGVVGRTEVPAWFNTAWAGFAAERRKTARRGRLQMGGLPESPIIRVPPVAVTVKPQ